NEIVVRALWDTVEYPENPKPLAPWARRLKAAHYNAVENLVVFAALVLTAHALGITTAEIAGSADVYCWPRFVHAVVSTFAIPWVRTLAFTVGFGCQVCVAWQILR